MPEWILHLFTFIIGPGFGGYFGWVFGRRKYRAETRSEELNNEDKNIDLYRKRIADQNEWLSDLSKRMDQMEAENEKLRAHLLAERKDNASLRKRVVQLEVEMEKWRKSEL